MIEENPILEQRRGLNKCFLFEEVLRRISEIVFNFPVDPEQAGLFSDEYLMWRDRFQELHAGIVRMMSDKELDAPADEKLVVQCRYPLILASISMCNIRKVQEYFAVKTPALQFYFHIP